MSKLSASPETEEEFNNRIIRRKTFISFLFFFSFIGTGIYLWKWLLRQPLDGDIRGGILQPLRTGLQWNEKLFGETFSKDKLVKTYPVSEAAKNVRVNGNYGMSEDFDPASWKLNLAKKSGDVLTISLDEIKQIKKTDIVFDFKCIEGWSQVSWWGGVRFSDFMEHFHLEEEWKLRFAGLSTVDEDYYVGIDMPSALHPQTILCYEMNGKDLPLEHGYPLRLIIPVKYGVKSIKRIGNISFTDEAPADYWAERGYDYYIGL